MSPPELSGKKVYVAKIHVRTCIVLFAVLTSLSDHISLRKALTILAIHTCTHPRISKPTVTYIAVCC